MRELAVVHRSEWRGGRLLGMRVVLFFWGGVMRGLAIVNRSSGIRFRGGCREKYEEICANEEKAVTLRSVWQSAAK